MGLIKKRNYIRESKEIPVEWVEVRDKKVTRLSDTLWFSVREPLILEVVFLGSHSVFLSESCVVEVALTGLFRRSDHPWTKVLEVLFKDQRFGIRNFKRV